MSMPVSTTSETVGRDIHPGCWAQDTPTLQSSQSHSISPLTRQSPASETTNSSARKRSFDVANMQRDTRPPSNLQQMQVPSTLLLPSLVAAPPTTTDSQLHFQQSASPATGPQTQIPRPPAMQETRGIASLTMDSLNSFQKRTGRLSEIESQRFSLLQEACAQKDLFYLCMHQIFCVAFLDPIRTVVTRFGEEQYAGLNLLTLVLLSNQDLSAEVVKFFSGLPAPLDKLMNDSFGYRNIVAQVGIFLGRFAALWDFVRESSFRRGSPPFVDELIDMFEVRSPIMQKVLFNSIHRQIGGTDDTTWGKQGLRLFTANQAQHQARRRNDANQDSRTRQGKLAEQKALEEQYRALRTGAANFPSHGDPSGYIATAGYSNAMQCSTSQPQDASNGVASRQVLAQSPHNSIQQQYPSYPQRAPAPTLNLLPRSQSANSLRVDTEFANTSNPTGPPSASRIQQLSSPMNPPNLVRNVSPGGRQSSPLTPQRRRGRPPLSNRPVVPHTSTSSVQHGSQRRNGELRSSASQADPNPFMLIPAHDREPFQTSNPNTNQLALHQAHLRSPVTEKLTSLGQRATDIRLYQYLSGFALPPKFLDGKSSLLSWDFQATASEISKRATDVISSDLQVKRLVYDGCATYRLRSVGVPQDAEMIEEADWSVKDTSWPPWCFLRFNEVDLELRRKSHHGKDLPVDVTPYLREGANSITVAFLAATAAKGYALAVEKIEIGDQARVDSARTMLAADQSLRLITQSLRICANGTTDGDDDVQIADSHISIDLVDPFMATIFDIPARGKTCAHRECFDLPTFFQTRKSRVKDGPISPDEWKCPICKRDARPQSLIVDSFLKTVRDSLVASGVAADAKAILVSGDGSWNVKKESGDTTANKTREDSIATVAASPATSKDTVRGDASRSQSVVIEIEDD